MPYDIPPAIEIGHISANVIDFSEIVTLSDCSAQVTENCIPVVRVPECPADKPALDCIPVER